MDTMTFEICLTPKLKMWLKERYGKDCFIPELEPPNNKAVHLNCYRPEQQPLFTVGESGNSGETRLNCGLEIDDSQSECFMVIERL